MNAAIDSAPPLDVSETTRELVTSNEVVTIKGAVKRYNLSVGTLRAWSRKGHLRTFRTPGNHRMFRRTDIERLLGFHESSMESGATKSEMRNGHALRRNIVYCRVSSPKQKDDLQRQIEFARSRYPEHDLVSDVGSGLNFRRKGLRSILEHCLRGTVGEVVVAHRDRLCRFGFELFKFLVRQAGGRLRVLDNNEAKSDEQELAEDLLSVVHVFSRKQMGKRRYERRAHETEVRPKKAQADGEDNQGK